MRSLLLLLLVACAPPALEEAAPDDLSFLATFDDGTAGPPVAAMGLLTPAELVRGHSMAFTAGGTAPGAPVALIASANSTTRPPCPPALNGECLDVASPYFVLATAMADHLGVARFSVTIPGGLPPGEILLQAASRNGPTVYKSSVQLLAVVDARDTADTGVPFPYLRPTEAYLTASFNYDPTTDSAVSLMAGTVTQFPNLQLFLANDLWDGTIADTSNYCAWYLEPGQDVPAAPGFTTDAGGIFGLEFPNTGTVDDCSHSVDPIRYRNLNAVFASQSWTVGILEDVDPGYANLLVNSGAFTQTAIDNEVLGMVMGGSLGAELHPSGYARNGLSFGYRVSAAGLLLTDVQGDLIPMTSDQMVVAGQLQRGAYSLQYLVPISVIDSWF